MSWLWRTLAGRLVLALLLAAMALAVLSALVAHRDEAVATAKPPPRPPPLAPSPLLALGFELSPTSAGVLLASRLAALPPDTAPVVEVFADGALALRRAAPIAPSPTAAVRRAGVLLPGRRLLDLTPAARGSLVQLLEALRAERPVLLDGVVAVDLLDGGGLPSLLSWVP